MLSGDPQILPLFPQQFEQKALHQRNHLPLLHLVCGPFDFEKPLPPMENPALFALAATNTDLQAPNSLTSTSFSNHDGISEVHYVQDPLPSQEVETKHTKSNVSCADNQHTENKTSYAKVELAKVGTPFGIKSEAPEQGNNSHLQRVPALALDHSDGQLYPMPLATHEAVIQDNEFFMTTLNSFLAALGITMKIPKMEGKDMDLYTLYCEVTARGGLEQVIRYARWKEIMEVLHILPSSHVACFVVRKHYTNLLFHYEQVYFFRVEGHVKCLPVPLPAPKLAAPADAIGSPYEAPTELMPSLKKRKRKLDPMQVFGVDPAAVIGTMVTGAINGKLDEGYLVTILVGEEKLTGVLYHVALENKVQQFARVPSLLKGVGSDLEAPGLTIQVYGKKKRRLLRKDPNVPRTTKSGYNIFLKEQRALLKKLYPETKGLGKEVIAMWGTLPENEKSLYQARGLQEREKFKREYQERLKQQAQISDGANDWGGYPLNANHDHDTSDVSHGYHVSVAEECGHTLETDEGRFCLDGSESQFSKAEMSAGGQLDMVKVYGMQEENYAEEENDEAYGEEEQEAVYPGVDQSQNRQDGSDYLVSNQRYHVQYQAHVNKSEVQDTQVHDAGLAASKQPHGFGSDNPYPSSLPHRQGVNSHNLPGSIFASEHVAYQQGLEDGQALHSHLQHSCADALRVLPPHLHQGHPLDGYGFARVRQGQARGEALGLPVLSDQLTYHKQGEGIAHPSNVQTRQMASEQDSRPRYPHPINVPYSQLYAWPHTYHMQSPQDHPFPVQVGDVQAHLFWHRHPMDSYGHQTQVTRSPDGSEAPAHCQARGHAMYHAQDDG